MTSSLEEWAGDRRPFDLPTLNSIAVPQPSPLVGGRIVGNISKATRLQDSATVIQLVVSKLSTVRLQRRQDGGEILFVNSPSGHRPVVNRASDVLVCGRIELLLSAFLIKPCLLVIPGQT